MFKASITLPKNKAVWFCSCTTERKGSKYDFSQDYKKAVSLSEHKLKEFKNYHIACGYTVNEYLDLSEA